MRPRFRFVSPIVLLASLVAFGGQRAPLRAEPDDPPAADADDEVAADEADPDEDEAPDTHGADAPGVDEEGDGAGAELAHADAGAHPHRAHRGAHGGCPASMVRVREYCVDRYEAPNRRGAKPLAMQSANDAKAWCAEHDKRLCTEDEWIGACEGEERRAYPYGETHVDSRCNDDKPWQKVDEATLATWPSPEAHAHAKELYQATPSGWKRKCASEDGVHDLTGNVEEWVVRTREHANAWPFLLIGCYWSGCYGGGKPTCRSTNDAHGPEFRFYETGFRCCRDAARPH